MNASEIDQGVWFQSACSGLWYQNHLAAGSIANVRVDGVQFAGPPIVDQCKHGVECGDFGNGESQ